MINLSRITDESESALLSPGLELPNLREKIDELDKEISALLQERLLLVHELGKIKQQSGSPVKDAAREAEVIERVTKDVENPRIKKSIAKIYRRIMSESRLLQEEERRPIEGVDNVVQIPPA